MCTGHPPQVVGVVTEARFLPMLPLLTLSSRNIRSKALTDQAVMDEKENGEHNDVETLRLDFGLKR